MLGQHTGGIGRLFVRKGFIKNPVRLQVRSEGKKELARCGRGY